MELFTWTTDLTDTLILALDARRSAIVRALLKLTAVHTRSPMLLDVVFRGDPGEGGPTVGYAELS
jgi:hypothetical protein